MGHTPVLESEVPRFLVWDADGLYVDGTVGCGGHARGILRHLSASGRLWGFDWDADVLEIARAALAGEEGRVRLFNESFSRIGERLAEEGALAHGIFVDLGLNSAVLDQPSRGFQYADPTAPLDMRMDLSLSRTAGDLLRDLEEEELITLLRELGEVRRPRAAARAIVRGRERAPIETAGDLASILRRAGALPGGPAELSRIFQALRMRVNRELEEIDSLLRHASDWLVPGGRLLVIAYESLSDRRVKQLHRKEPGADREPRFRMLTKKVVRPGRDEVLGNARARSARLRALERKD